MSAGLGAILGDISGDPSFGSWVEPWVNAIFAKITPGSNPYDVFLPTVQEVFYPTVWGSFRSQLHFLTALFSIAATLILTGLILRIFQGRFWILHRIDRTIITPNISVSFGLAALAYTIIGIVYLVEADKVAQGEAYPHYWTGIQVAWPWVLWFGIYTEIWATFAALYIRKYGAYYKESKKKSVVYLALPFVVPIIGIVPPAIVFMFASNNFHQAISGASLMEAELMQDSAAWTPAKGLDISTLALLFPFIKPFAEATIDYSKYARIGWIYAATFFFLTFFVYVTGVVLEIRHLRAQAQILAAQKDVDPEKNKVDTTKNDWLEAQSVLLDWAATNRTATGVMISLMLLENAGLATWFGSSVLGLKNNSVQFQTTILVPAYMNGTLATVVSLLILFRSMDGSSQTTRSLKRWFPFLPLPPPGASTPGVETMAALHEVDEREAEQSDEVFQISLDMSEKPSSADF